MQQQLQKQQILLQQQMQQQQKQQTPENYSQENQFASYYSHNFDTLQNNNNKLQKSVNNMSFLDDNGFNNSFNNEFNNGFNNGFNNEFGVNNGLKRNEPPISTHSGGLPLLNPRNMYSMGNYEEVSNKYNNNGYAKVEEKKMDYRQNMNSKMDNFIFDNPNAIEPNPILQQARNNQNQYGQTKDTRMVIQDSNKDFYRQSANDRMSQYSPLSRASNMPIAMANMSVNDFYSNLNNGQPTQPSELSNKDTMNSRIGNYSPLAKTIQYQTQTQTQPQTQTQSQTQPQYQQSSQTQPQYQQAPQQPQKWNPTDVNPKLQNVVFKNLPVNSNANLIK
jgi:hypothetical protein